VAVSKDIAFTTIRKAELAESFATRAVELLALAHAAGHTKDPEFVRQLNTDKDFALIRSRADFKKLLSAIAAKP
jgi:hypothetical protein